MHLEEAFIEKISEVTRLQANILSSATNLNSNSLSMGTYKHSHHEESLNLHDESPIKPARHRPQTQTDKKPENNQRKQIPVQNSQTENNPEHSQPIFAQ